MSDNTFRACAALAERMQGGRPGDTVHITMVKEAGSDTFERSFVASSTSAAVNALALLVRDLAKMLDVPTIHIISVLTLMLTDPGKEGSHGS